MSTSKKNIDQLLKDKLSDNGFVWTDGEWGAFKDRYKEKKKRRGVWWWMLSSTGVLVVLGFVLWGMDVIKYDTVKEELVDNSTTNKTIIVPENESKKVEVEKKNITLSKSNFNAAANSNLYQAPVYRSSNSGKKYARSESVTTNNSNKIVEPNKDNSLQPEVLSGAEQKLIKENKIPETKFDISTPIAEQKVPDTMTNKRIDKKKSSSHISFYLEPIFAMGGGALSSEVVAIPLVPANNHSRDFSANYIGGYGLNMGVNLNKHISMETGVAQHQYKEVFTYVWDETISVYTSKSYTTLKIDTATGKINSAPVITTSKHDSTIYHIDKSTNIYSYLQIPIMVYYHTAITKQFNILLGAGSSIHMMQLKNRNANALYGYDPTGNMIQPKVFASFALKGGLEWKPLPMLSFTLNESIVMGKAEKDIYTIKLKQYATQFGVRFYINTK